MDELRFTGQPAEGTLTWFKCWYMPNVTSKQEIRWENIFLEGKHLFVWHYLYSLWHLQSVIEETCKYKSSCEFNINSQRLLTKKSVSSLLQINSFSPSLMNYCTRDSQNMENDTIYTKFQKTTPIPFPTLQNIIFVHFEDIVYVLGKK